MNFSCTKDKLLQGLQLIEHITGRNSSLPVLQNVLIRAANHSLYIIGTDLEMGMQASVSAKTNKEGEVSVPLKTLLGFIRTLPEGLLECKEQNKHLSIRAGEFHAQIKGEDPSQYPLLPKRAQEEPFSLSAKEFAQTISYAVPSIANTDSKPELTGVYIHVSEDGMVAAATDSFRLAEKTLSFEKKPSKEFSFILPQKSAREIINIFSEKDGKLKLFFSPNQVLFEYPMAEIDHAQIQVVSRIIDGGYPDYQGIIPKKYSDQIILPKEELLNHIKTAGVFSGKTNEIKLTPRHGSGQAPAKEGVEIFSQNPDLGENSGFVQGRIKREPDSKETSISFNYRFLIDGISNIKDSEVVLELNGEDGPAAVKSKTDSSYIYIVMPIKST